MFKIFIDYNKLLEIIKGDTDNTWYQIFMKQNSIAVNHEFKDDPEDPLFIFGMNGGNIVFSDESNYINEVISNNEKVLDNPCGAFYLNIDSETAMQIQNNYGVICQNCEEMNPEYLTKGDFTTITIQKNTWEDCFLFIKFIPSNTLIIVDRYLFSSEYNETIDDSITNIIDIMNAFMPGSFGAEYHLCIIFDETKFRKKDKINFERLSERLNGIKNEFAKKNKYQISLELLSCSCLDYESYKKTHDRKILSNYFSVMASHKLKAFRQDKQPILKQKIDLLSLCGKGLSDDFSDLPQIAYEDDINDLRNIVSAANNLVTQEAYRYSCDGDINIATKNIKNRILV